MTAGIGTGWSLRFLPTLNIQWFCGVCLWLLEKAKAYIHGIAKGCSDHRRSISIESRLKMSSRESQKCAPFLLLVKKPQPQCHRICSDSIMEKAWTKSSTSYKQLHSSEGQLWNLTKTIPTSHSTNDHTRRAILVSVFHCSFLKSLGKLTIKKWHSEIQNCKSIKGAATFFLQVLILEIRERGRRKRSYEESNHLHKKVGESIWWAELRKFHALT